MFYENLTELSEMVEQLHQDLNCTNLKKKKQYISLTCIIVTEDKHVTITDQAIF